MRRYEIQAHIALTFLRSKQPCHVPTTKKRIMRPSEYTPRRYAPRSAVTPVEATSAIIVPSIGPIHDSIRSQKSRSKGAKARIWVNELRVVFQKRKIKKESLHNAASKDQKDDNYPQSAKVLTMEHRNSRNPEAIPYIINTTVNPRTKN